MGCTPSKKKADQEPYQQPQQVDTVPDSDWKMLWELHEVSGRDLSSIVTKVYLVYSKTKGTSMFFASHGSIHLAIPRGCYIRLDMSGLRKMRTKLLRPITKEEIEAKKPGEESMYPWVQDPDQPAVKAYEPTESETPAYEFTTSISAYGREEVAKGISCAKWSAQVIGLFIIDRLIEAEFGHDVHAVFREFESGPGEKCRFDDPSGKKWLEDHEARDNEVQGAEKQKSWLSNIWHRRVKQAQVRQPQGHQRNRQQDQHLQFRQVSVQRVHV
ncbi:hypothetical protein GE09DRAFT_1060755 [Coniochaeta sp. 2T2.1]|nr:hypothetical protein GE09DRAFT_1060755 [Coniochaeta sp. 2T2.1]